MNSISVKSYLRQWKRKQTSLTAKIDVLVRSGKIFAKGTCRIKNISYKGALLSNFKLKPMSLPAESFSINLLILDSKYPSVSIHAKPVHFDKSKSFAIGVQFDGLEVTN